MNKHTSGPWSVDPSKSFYVFGPARLSKQAGLSHGPFICNASSQANAHLIAAAPDLLYALRELVAEFDSRHADEDHRTGYTLDTGGIAAARAAIARATGDAA
jgi:hypothetical protein